MALERRWKFPGITPEQRPVHIDKATFLKRSQGVDNEETPGHVLQSWHQRAGW